MAEHNGELTPAARIRAIMDELGLDWEAAALLYAVESGDAMVDDVVFEWTKDGRSSNSDRERAAEESNLPSVPRR